MFEAYVPLLYRYYSDSDKIHIKNESIFVPFENGETVDGFWCHADDNSDEYDNEGTWYKQSSNEAWKRPAQKDLEKYLVKAPIKIVIRVKKTLAKKEADKRLAKIIE